MLSGILFQQDEKVIHTTTELKTHKDMLKHDMADRKKFYKFMGCTSHIYQNSDFSDVPPALRGEVHLLLHCQ